MPDSNQTPFVKSVFHPSDFSEASNRAFAHALAVALVRQTQLTILHVGGKESDWQGFPAVRQTLERWGFLEPGSSRNAVFDNLAVRVKKVQLKGRKPGAAIREYLKWHPQDLIVLSTAGRNVPQWMQRSVAERLAEETGTMTLFVPQAAEGFISLETGDMLIKRILVPVAPNPSPKHALEYTRRIVEAAGSEATEVVLLHVGESKPDVSPPEGAQGVWKIEQRKGDVVAQVLAAASDFDPDLVIMATAGHDGILDALRGSVTEKVLREASCPLLAVPPMKPGMSLV